MSTKPALKEVSILMKCFPEKEESEKTLAMLFMDSLSDAVFTSIQFCHYAGLKIDAISFAIGRAVGAIYYHVAERSDRNGRMTEEDRLNFLRLIRESLTNGFTDYLENRKKHTDLKPRSNVDESGEN